MDARDPGVAAEHLEVAAGQVWVGATAPTALAAGRARIWR